MTKVSRARRAGLVRDHLPTCDRALVEGAEPEQADLKGRPPPTQAHLGREESGFHMGEPTDKKFAIRARRAWPEDREPDGTPPHCYHPGPVAGPAGGLQGPRTSNHRPAGAAQTRSAFLAHL